MKKFIPWLLLAAIVAALCLLLPEARALIAGGGVLGALALGGARAKTPTHADLSPRAQSDIRAVEADAVAAALRRARDLDANRGGADSHPH